MPAPVGRLRDQVGAADRVLAITPEYNGTMPAVLNNAIDWLSRPYGASALSGKPFAALGATPTRFGGKWSHEDARRSATVAGATSSPTSRSPSRPSTARTSWPTRSSWAGCSAPWTPSSRTGWRPSRLRDTLAGMSELTPYLCVADARAAIEWYVEALGAEVAYEPIIMDDGRVGHCELEVAGARWMMSDEFEPTRVSRRPTRTGAPPSPCT